MGEEHCTIGPDQEHAGARRWHDLDPDGSTRIDALRRALAERPEGDPTWRPPEEDLCHARLAGLDLSGIDLSRCDLRHADLRNCNLAGTNLAWAKLQHATLSSARLDDCIFLSADLSHAILNEVSAARAEFGTATLVEAKLISGDFTDAGFAEADLTRADLCASRLVRASLRNSILRQAIFRRARLESADLKNANVDEADFESADLSCTSLLGMTNFTTAMWIGVDLRGADFNGAYRARRFIMDENYLFEFRTQGTLYLWLYRVWWVTSDCGRSFVRWSFWVLALTLVYAGLYTLVDIDYGRHETLFSPVYYSFVTLTTLGYGDVTPASLPAQVLAVSQAVLGYIGLGGLLAILTNKMARRAD